MVFPGLRSKAGPPAANAMSVIYIISFRLVSVNYRFEIRKFYFIAK